MIRMDILFVHIYMCVGTSVYMSSVDSYILGMYELVVFKCCWCAEMTICLVEKARILFPPLSVH